MAGIPPRDGGGGLPVAARLYQAYLVGALLVEAVGPRLDVVGPGGEGPRDIRGQPVAVAAVEPAVVVLGHEQLLGVGPEQIEHRVLEGPQVGPQGVDPVGGGGKRIPVRLPVAIDGSGYAAA